MKLIIDIPEEAYKLRLTNPVWYDSNMDKAIKNGIPLEAIKEKINELSPEFNFEGFYVCQNKVLNILDKL